MEKKIEEKIPWKWIIPLVILWVALQRVFENFISFPVRTLGPNFKFPSNPLPAGFLGIILFLKLAGVKLKLNERTLAFLFIVTTIMCIAPMYDGTYYQFVGFVHSRVTNPESHGFALPSFWMPSIEATRNMFSGGADIAPYLSEWIPVMITWMVFPIVMTYMMFSLMLVLRRSWVEIEELPFPHSTQFMVASLITEKSDGRKTKVLLALALFGFLYHIPMIMIATNPAAPDIFGWFKSPYFITWDLGVLAASDMFPSLKGIVGPLWISTDYWFYALAFLAPLDSLLSIGLAYLLLTLVLPQILFYFGYYSGATEAGIWTKGSMIMTGDPLKLWAFGWGVLMWVIASIVIFNGKYLANTVKLALSGGSAKSEEASEYRWAYAMLIASIIAAFIFFGISGISPIPCALLLMVAIIWVLPCARSHAYSGITPGSWEGGGAVFFYPLWGRDIGLPPPLGNETAEQLFTMALSSWTFNSWGNQDYTMGPAVWASTSYKVGQMGGIRGKDVYKTLLVVEAIAAIVTVPVMIACFHAWGLMSVPVGKEWDFMAVGERGSYINLPAPEPWWPQALAGFIVGALLSFARIRFVRFPLEPMGFFVATAGTGPSWGGIGFICLMAWIVKYLMIRFGGRKVYEDYGIPAAVGLNIGYILSILVSAIAVMIRFLSVR